MKKIVSDVSVGNIFNLPKHRLIANHHATYPMQKENLELSFESQGVETNKKDIDKILELNGQKNFGTTFKKKRPIVARVIIL